MKREKKNALALILFVAVIIAFFYASTESNTINSGDATGISTGDFTEQPDSKNIRTPQDRYSVSTAIKSFDLSASGNGSLTYNSSDSSVADVSRKGRVKVKNNGIAYITISDGTNSKRVEVKVSDYIPANGYFIEGMSDIDKKPGDSTGREVREKKYPGYKKSDHSRSWGFIIRCNDPEIADRAALIASYIAKNDSFGYKARMHTSQSSVDARASVYNAVVKVTGKNPSIEDLEKIKTITETADSSCSPTILAGYWLYYDLMSDKIPLKWRPPYDKETYNYYCGAVNVEYHQLEKAIEHVNNEYRKRGMLEPFEIIYISANERSSFFKKSNVSNNLKRGDIVCSCPDYKGSGHTGIIM